jgi:two-component system, cell cycle sensor histidine kinase and response regulator CckA
MSLDMICIADLNTTHFVKVNDAFTDTLGFAEEDLLGKPFMQFIHPDDVDITREVVEKKLLKGEKIFNFENRYRCIDGTYRWLSWVSHPDLEKGVTYAAARDITETKTYGQALKASESLLKEAQAVAHIGSWWCDIKKGELRWTDELFRVYGLAPQEGKLCLEYGIDMIHPEDREIAENTFRKAFTLGVPYEMEYRIIRPDGEERVVHAIGKVQADGEGNVLSVYGTGQDVTGRRQAEAALRKSEKNYRELVEDINDIIFRTDEHGVFTYVSPVVRTLEYEPKELIGRHFEEIIFPEDVERVAGRFRALMWLDNRPLEYRVVTRSGEAVWVRSSSKPVFDGEKFMGIQGMVTDISEERALQAQLLQAQKLEAVATMTGGIAHDYNNLLSIIMGNLEMAIQDAPYGSDQLLCLKELEKASNKVKDLTHDLMALSRGSAPVKAVRPLQLALKRVAHSVPVDGGHSVQDFIARDLWPVAYDSNKMDAVFRNVVTNAVEAMHEGGTLTIKAENLRVEDGEVELGLSMHPGDYVRISIQDEGKGIPEEDLDRIFDPYFSSKPMGVQKGMGLGLAVAHSVVIKHGGHIAVQSIPNKGTTVRIYLPAMPVEEAAQSRPSTAIGKPEAVKWILLMEDEETLGKLAKKMLKRLGFEARTVKNGKDAIEAYEKKMDSDTPFEAVILDLTIKGGMGGESVLRKLREIDPHVRAILCSGYWDDPVMSDFDAYGFKAAIPKPYEMKDLKTALEKALR